MCNKLISEISILLEEEPVFTELALNTSAVGIGAVLKSASIAILRSAFDISTLPRFILSILPSA